MSNDLVTLEVAKSHLRITHSDDDPDIERKITQASWIILDYIKKRDAPWTDADVPPPIQAAVLMMLEKLYDDRAAGQEGNQYVALGYLTPPITAILHRFRDPAMA